MYEPRTEPKTWRPAQHDRRVAAWAASLVSLALLLGACSALPEWLQEPLSSGSVASDDAALQPAPEPEPESAAAPPATSQPANELAHQTTPQTAAEADAGTGRAQPSGAESAPREQAAADQTAALPPAEEAPGVTRILFPEGSFELSRAAKDQLLEVTKTLAQDGSTRVRLLAFALGAGGGARRARRLSLTRALVVRAFLLDQGVRSERVGLRSLGDKVEDGPPDRVDVLLVEGS